MRHSTRILAFSSIALTHTLAFAQNTERVCVDSLGAQSNGASFGGSLSADGRFVAFSSRATALVPNDTNGVEDVFVRDRLSNGTARISIDGAGSEANGPSTSPAISKDGKFVAFASTATNLVSADTNGLEDVFLRNLASGAVQRISVDSLGAQANGVSTLPSLSADGRFVVFESDATNLVANDTNGVRDVFVRDVLNGATVRASVDALGAQGNAISFSGSISSDGHRVAFASLASNLVASDTNGTFDIFVRDLTNGQVSLVSQSTLGVQGKVDSFSPRISGNGRFVAFHSWAWNLVSGDSNTATDVFVRDLQLGTTTRVSVTTSGAQSNGNTIADAISSDGRFVLFHGAASNLVVDDTNGKNDVFVHDLQTGLTSRVSLGFDGVQATSNNLGATGSSISDDGKLIAFVSDAANLVPGDTNLSVDVFVRDRQCATPTAYCTAKMNSLGCVPTIASAGTPSMASNSSFTIAVSHVLSHKNGFLFYGLTGQQSSPFQGGLLCVNTPLHRTSIQNSGGNPPPDDCSGVLSVDFNALIASGADPLLVTGTSVDAQFWSRDPGFSAPNDTNLSDAIHFGICE